jgi:polysaccharide pyruvyl transferase CsaB
MQKLLHTLLQNKKRVVIHGFYGSGNLGDEFLLSAILRQIHALKFVQPVVFSGNPSETRSLHQVKSFNPYARRELIGNAILLGTNVYILGGGGLIKDYGDSAANVKAWLHWLTIAKNLGLKTMLWSIGVENIRFDESKEAIRQVLKTVDVITVRDINSKNKLEEIGVQNQITVTADPAIFLTGEQSNFRSLKKNFRVIVCLRHWFNHSFSILDDTANQKMLDAIAMVLDRMVNKWHVEIEFIPFRTTDYDDDRKILKSLLDRMQEKSAVAKIHESVPKIDEIINIFTNADLVIGMRLHSVIIATSLGIPSIALSYMPKVRDYMKHINQERFCLEIEEVSYMNLYRLVEEIVNNYENISAQLTLTKATMYSKLQKNVDLLSQLLTTNQVFSTKVISNKSS